MTKRIPITISLPEEMVAQLDEYAKEAKMDRSHFLEWTFEQVLPLMPAALALLRTAFRSAGVKIEEENESGEPG